MVTRSRRRAKKAGRHAVLLLGLTLAGCSADRALESMALLEDISNAASGIPADPNRPPPLRDLVHYSVEGRHYEADLYQPSETSPSAAVVLVPGAVPEGRNDHRLVGFATALTRSEFMVLVPEIANLRELRVAPSDIAATGDAVVHLSDRADGGPVGLIAISYSAGPALIAAAQDPVRGRLAFLVAVGGYADMERLITYFTTGKYREPGATAWRSSTPNPAGKWLFLRNNLHKISDLGDRQVLAKIAERKLADPKADVGAIGATLGAEGLSVMALLENEDPELVPQLIAALPVAIREDMERLDPSRHALQNLEARLWLIHGRDDRVIPFTESLALEQAVPEQGRVDLYIVDNLAHVDLEAPSLADSLTLWRAAYDVLEIRDELPSPRPLTKSEL